MALLPPTGTLYVVVRSHSRQVTFGDFHSARCRCPNTGSESLLHDDRCNSGQLHTTLCRVALHKHKQINRRTLRDLCPTFFLFHCFRCAVFVLLVGDRNDSGTMCIILESDSHLGVVVSPLVCHQTVDGKPNCRYPDRKRPFENTYPSQLVGRSFVIGVSFRSTRPDKIWRCNDPKTKYISWQAFLYDSCVVQTSFDGARPGNSPVMERSKNDNICRSRAVRFSYEKGRCERRWSHFSLIRDSSRVERRR